MTPPEGRKVGIDGVLEASNIIRQVVPNLHIEVEHLLITGNYATVRYRFKGNLTGAMIDNKDNKDKGQSIDFPVVDIYYVVNGKIHKTWHHLKYNTFFKQVK
ncbi:ester cyclase [Vibrio mediterranei]|nr:ester cyclase [Vibrio mediterranei]